MQTLKAEEIVELDSKYIVQTYGRPPFVLERGNGVHLFDTDGVRYLDFMSGLSVNAFGYGDFDITEVIKEQSAKLIHCCNLYHSVHGPILARMLVDNSFADRVFYCNSGTESIEASLKFARRWGHENFDKPKYRIMSFENSFHGRTYGGLTATGQFRYHKGFDPLLPGIDFARLNDLGSVEEKVSDETCAILIEPILQIEGGLHKSSQEFIEGLRKICDDNDMLLIFDEVQSGLARTGLLFGYEHYGVEPDIMTLAKPLAGGLPMGATLVREKVAKHIHPGDHAATFGGNPLVSAVAIRVFRKLTSEGFLDSVRQKGEYLHTRLNRLKDKWPQMIKEIRGIGLIAGAVTECEAKLIADAFQKRNILLCTAGPDVVRFLPPLVVEKEHIGEAVDVFDEILTQGVEKEQ